MIVARGPAEVKESPGAWVLVDDRDGTAEELAQELAARNQTVVLTGNDAPSDGKTLANVSGIVRTSLDMTRRESWRSLLESLPANLPLNGVVHLAALSGHGAQATTEELAADAKQAGAGALALVQGIADADVTPAKGVWFVTRGGQVLEKERAGELVGAALWGFGKVVAREMPHLKPRMIDLAPGEAAPKGDLVNELMYPDTETHLAYRQGIRRVSRLVRMGSEALRLTLPEESAWMLSPDAGGALEKLQVEPLPPRPLQSGDVRVAVEAVGLNFLDVFRGIGMIDTGRLGEEMCGRIIEVGAEVSTVAVGDRVVGFAFGTFGSEAVTPQELVTLAPPGMPVAALATMPTVFVTAALSFDLAALKAGERVLIHAGAGGVGLAAIQLAHAAGAEVFATASAPKQAYLRSLGVKHVFDSRQTRFGREILEATGGEGVHVVLNSLTGEGFIEASLSCLAHGGRFVELARLGILSEAEMSAARPDVAYSILELDVLKERDPAQPGAALKNVMERLAAGELTPLVHNRWSLTEAGSAMDFMRAARHVGKNVLTMPPLARGTVAGRPDLPGDRRSWRDRVRFGCLAGGPGRRRYRAERAPRPGPRGRRSHRRAAPTRRAGAGGTGRRDGRGGGGRHAGTHRRDAAAARGHHPQRGRVVGRGVDEPDVGEVRRGAVAENAGGMATAPGNFGPRSGPVRRVLEHHGRRGQFGSGQSWSGQRISGSTRGPPAGAGARRPVGRVGGVVRAWRGRGAAGADRKTTGGSGNGLDHARSRV